MFSPLIVELIGVHSYKQVADLTFEDKKYKLTSLKGFISDAASIPAIFHTVVGCPFGEKYTKPAIIHDLLYRSGVFDRRMCDYLFLRMMLAEKVDRKLARSMYLAVRAAGWTSYNSGGVTAKYRDFVKVEVKD